MTKEQSQRRARNLLPIMVFNGRPICKDRHAAEPSWPGECGSKRPNTLPQTCLSTKFTLAVTRRTIHNRKQSVTLLMTMIEQILDAGCPSQPSRLRRSDSICREIGGLCIPRLDSNAFFADPWGYRARCPDVTRSNDSLTFVSFFWVRIEPRVAAIFTGDKHPNEPIWASGTHGHLRQ